MKRKKLLALAAATLVAFILITAMYAADNSYSADVQNVITTGDVGITLSDTSNDASKVEAISGATLSFAQLYPGASVQNTVSVKNDKSETVWLRVKIDTLCSGTDFSSYVSENIDPASWMHSGKYYYYKWTLAKEQDAPLFDTVVFAPSIGSDFSGKPITMTVTAEALQAKNVATLDAAIKIWTEGSGT